MTKLALASYFCEVLDLVVYENMQETELLRLGLNSFHAIANDLRPLPIIKAVFEMRACLLLGFAPNMERCSVCGRKNATSFCFSLMDGEIVCGDCRERALHAYFATQRSVNAEEERRYATQIYLISENVRAAVRYLTTCPADKIYGFTMPEADVPQLCKLCEDHLTYRLEKKLRTLDFYHEVEAL